MPGAWTFGPFELDPGRRRLVAGGQAVGITDRQVAILSALVANAGQIVSKDALVRAGWQDVAVGDNSLEQAISGLRRIFAEHDRGAVYIDTVARRGYRFSAPVQRVATRESDEALDALLAPHRAFVEGRAALESPDPVQVEHARDGFERAVQAVPDHAVAHRGLATACVMQFEMTRADPAPDRASLERAEHHARESCRLDPQAAESWATLGFVLGQTDDHARQVDARAALQRATTLEPSNWRHHFRLAAVSWGEERLSAARRALALLPGSPLAHWMAASVFVARQLLDDADRELTAGIDAQATRSSGDSRFHSVALHWLRGLVRLAQGDTAAAMIDFERELEIDPSQHLYARECAANTWYAIGIVHRRDERAADAALAFERALALVPSHPMTRAALGLPARGEADGASAKELVAVHAAEFVLAGDYAAAGKLIDGALAFAPPGNAAWLLPVEPLFDVSQHRSAWSGALTRLRQRAS